MRQFLINFIENTWSLVAEMAPYLLFGFAIAGLLHVLIRREFVERWLGRPGIRGVINASLLGVPMPLCSCSVIPVAASMRKSGATRGATASFLSSTPQTGVDSILATYALLGALFTAVRVGVAFLCGVIAGYLIERFCADEVSDASDQNSDDRTAGTQSDPPSDDAEDADCCRSNTSTTKTANRALRYGFVTLPADLGKALIFGLLLAGLVTTLMPADLLSGTFSSGLMAFALATVISVPLYVCATASIPMAFGLIAAGLSPGAALVFLITGPATNTATIATVWKMLGRRATAIYLSSLLIISWLAGWTLNASLGSQNTLASMHAHGSAPIAFWQHGSGVLLLGLLLFALRVTRQPKAKSCCAH